MMPSKDRRTQTSPEPAPHPLTAEIDRNVLSVLGHPEQLFGVQVKWLWDNCYRVNVLLGGDAASVKVAHSYFVVADEGGRIVTSTPKIVPMYGAGSCGVGSRKEP